MNEILVAKNALAEDLHEFGCRQVALNHRRICGDLRGKDRSHGIDAAPLAFGSTNHDPIRLNGVDNGMALTQELRTPHQGRIR